MFHDLDKTLNNLLNDSTAPKELRDAEVSFATPDRNFAPDQATVNLFLHEVKENLELRDLVPVITIQDTVYTRHRPPLRVDCAYLVSAWSNETGAKKVEDEHRLLGLAFAWLNRFPTIPDSYLSGGLADQPFPPPTLVAQMDGNRHSGEFWTALGIAPRPTFSLQVTIAMDLEDEIEAGPPVTGIQSRFVVQDGEPETFTTIGGRVLNVKEEPVNRALIQLVEAGLQATTDTTGRFQLPRPPDGNYTLRVSAAGFEVKEQALTVTNQEAEYKVEEYAITLTPPS